MNRTEKGFSGDSQALFTAGHDAELHARPSRARRLYEEALEALDPHHRLAMTPILKRAIGRTHFEEGHIGAAVDCFREALDWARAHGDDDGVANALNCLAVTAFNRGEISAAQAHFQDAQAVASSIGNPALVAMTDQNLGAIAALRGEQEEALSFYQRSLRAYRDLGLEDRIGPLLCNVGRMEVEVGEVDDADRTLQEAILRCGAAGDLPHEILARVNLSRVALARGAWAEAEQACFDARRRARAGKAQRWEGLILKQLGIVATRRGADDEALELLSQATSLAEAREDVVLQGEVAAEMARIYRAQERNRETLDALLRAHAVFKRVQAEKKLSDINLRLAAFETTFLDIVGEWGQSIDAKDPYTQGHCTRVAEYAVALAESDGLDPQVMIWFRMSALLHDVGKVMIPDEILQKEGALDDEEFAIVKQHPDAGATLLSGVDFPWDVIPTVRHHHERWDGKGYPAGLAGEEIPRTARILSIADVFDALTSDRPYRGAMDPETALMILESESGAAFDPELIALFKELVEANLFSSTWERVAVI